MFKGIRICRFCKTSFPTINPNVFYCSLKCRFWDKVEKLGPNECWNWTASKFHTGYGCFRYEEHLVSAHRIAWILTYGPIPKQSGYHGICALHKCDNRAYCNPSHLFLGTSADNKQDCVNKNRQAQGENHGQSKLTNNQVIKIKHELAEGTFHRIIAEKYRITRETITDINIGRSWSHI